MKFFLYNFFSKTLRDGRLEMLTFDETVAAIRVQFPECQIQPEFFEAYRNVWVERMNASERNPQ